MIIGNATQMAFRFRLIFIVAIALLIFTSCKDDDVAEDFTDGDTDNDSVSIPENCDSITPLFPAAPVLADDSHPCHDWLHRIAGRVGKGGASGSIAVWSLDTEATTGMIASAAHVLKSFSTNNDGSAPLHLVDPKKEIPFHFARLALADGEANSLYSATVLFFNPAMPAEQIRDGYRTITPRYDFFLAAIDAQLLSMDPMPEQPEPLQMTAPPVVDPEGLANQAPTHATAKDGELLMLIGYPTTTDLANQLAVSVAKVLAKDDAETALLELKQAGDEEGSIAYEAEVEAILEGIAATGMSGGGAFNRDGKFVGVLVRASDSEEVMTPIVRIVRADFIAGSLREAFQDLSDTEQENVRPFIDKNILSSGN